MNARGDDPQSPRVNAVFERFSARVAADHPDWEAATGDIDAAPDDQHQARWPVHPAADVFPLLNEDELAALADDIAENGLHEPIWLFNDAKLGEVLLDGRNRLAACELLGIDPETRLYEGADPVGFAISQNLHRRHLTAGQKAAVAERLLPLFERQARERKRQAGGNRTSGAMQSAYRKAAVSARAQEDSGPNGASTERRHERTAAAQAARAVGASPRAVEQFSRVKRAAPDLAKQVEAGTVPLGRAEQIVRDRAAPPVTPAREHTSEPLSLDLTGVTAIVRAPADWSGDLPATVEMDGIAGKATVAVVVDRRTFSVAARALEQAVEGADATATAQQARGCSADDYRRAVEGDV